MYLNQSALARKFRTPGLTKQKRSSTGTRHGAENENVGVLNTLEKGNGGAGWQSSTSTGDQYYHDVAHTSRSSNHGNLHDGPIASSSRSTLDHTYQASREDDDDESGYMPLSQGQLSLYGGAMHSDLTENSPSRPTGSGNASGEHSLSPQQGPLYYTCLWRVPNTRKKKGWDDDGIVIVGKGRIRLVDANTHAQLSESSQNSQITLSPSQEIRVGGKEVLIEEKANASIMQLSKKRNSDNQSPLMERTQPRKAFRVPQPKEPGQRHSVRPDPVSVESFYARDAPQEARFSGMTNPGRGPVPNALYDPEAKGAIVMARPTEEHRRLHNKPNRPVVDVVVDPILAPKLQPHQIEGVRFLYERLMGMRPSAEEIAREVRHMSAILADEMGLGKTLQTIVVIDLLLKQSCYYHPNLQTIQCALVVCDLSLVANWDAEFKKWRGDRLRVLCVTSETHMPKAARGTYDVIIVNYERLTRSFGDFKAMNKIGLIVCDEAHRLKSGYTQVTKCIKSLNIARCILLTGTPVQNRLGEFYVMIDIAAPDLLCGPGDFKQEFEDPILRSRQPDCTPKARKKGKECAVALKKITAPFILRRSAKLLEKYLPKKHEQVVFCSPSPMQLRLYKLIKSSKGVRALTQGRGGSIDGKSDRRSAFPLISALRKLCNSPELLLKETKDSGGKDGECRYNDLSPLDKVLGEEVAKVYAEEVVGSIAMSGKLKLLRRMLKTIKQTTDDKVVIVSNFTATLDVIEALCRKRYKYVRLDGQTKQQDRKGLVNKFNTSDRSESFLFLMSAKAGGVGINLIGANRIILLDGDWNPATDDQAMARIHRMGQQKECYIYRLLLSGTMDEKIFIRQVSKRGLTSSLLDDEGGESSQTSDDAFGKDALRAIFDLHTDTTCLTHDLLQCTCECNGDVSANKMKVLAEAETEPRVGFVTAAQALLDNAHREVSEYREGLAPLLKWSHYDYAKTPNCSTLLDDTILSSIMTQQAIARDAAGRGDEYDELSFDMSKAESGEILHVFARSPEEDDTASRSRSTSATDSDLEE